MSQWKVRILSGEHTGAEVSLLLPMVVGADEEFSDIVLDDLDILPAHVSLQPEPDGVRLAFEDVTYPIQLLGDETVDPDAYLPVQSALKIGELIIAVKESDEQWAEPVLNFQPADFDEATGAQANNSDAAPASAEGADKAVSDDSVSGQSGPANDEKNNKSPLFPAWLQKYPRLTLLCKCILVCGLMVKQSFVFQRLQQSGGGAKALIACSVFAIGAIYYLNAEVPEEAVTAIQQDEKDATTDAEVPAKESGENIRGAKEWQAIKRNFPSLSALLEKPVYANISLDYVDGETNYVVNGYVEKRAQELVLRSELNKALNTFSYQVFINEQMQDSIKLVLANIGMVPNELQLDDGLLTLIVDDEQTRQWAAAQKTLMRDVAGLQGIDIQVRNKRSAIEKFNALTAQTSLSGKLEYELMQDHIEISAPLNERDKQNLFLLMSEYVRQYGTEPLFKYKALPLPGSEMTLNSLDIIAIRNGETPYAVHKSGRRYTIGGRLPNGFLIEDFVEGKLVVVKGQSIHRISFRQDDEPGAQIAFQQGDKNPTRNQIN